MDTRQDIDGEDHVILHLLPVMWRDRQDGQVDFKDDTELFKQFSDNPAFKKWLTDTIFAVTYASDAA